MPGGDKACAPCLRRSELLALLGGTLDYRCRDRDRLYELLGLADEDLLRAAGGRRRDELRAASHALVADGVAAHSATQATCRHQRSSPTGLLGPGAPWMLNVAGGVGRLKDLTRAPCVAILGTTKATDYGLQMAKDIARGLAASGVTVTAGTSDGIALAAHRGALEINGSTVAVLSGGLGAACAGGLRHLRRRIVEAGCVVSELPYRCAPRRWSQAASERIPVHLATLALVVEASDDRRELAPARLAQLLGRPVAAVPGRVTSGASGGSHLLLMEGAHLVRGAADVLELLCCPGAPSAAARGTGAGRGVPANLSPQLRAILESVASGRDTPQRLMATGSDSMEVLLALSELELMGLLTRGDGGRYLPRYAQGPDSGSQLRERRSDARSA